MGDAVPASTPRLLRRHPEDFRGFGRRGGRVVECTALEMRHTCKRIGGSNPPLSASQSPRAYIFWGSGILHSPLRPNLTDHL